MDSRETPPAAILTVEYLGCRITVRGEVTPAGVRGSYAIVPVAGRTVSAFERLGLAAISGDEIEADDPQQLCEWAKCEIDFLLEQPF